MNKGRFLARVLASSLPIILVPILSLSILMTSVTPSAEAGSSGSPNVSGPGSGPSVSGPGSGPSVSGPGSGVRGGTAELKNPLNFKSISDFIAALLRAVIQIGLPIAVLFIVYAGFKFVAARGNPEDLAVARKNFLWTVIGIAIFLGSWALAQLIAATLRQIGANV